MASENAVAPKMSKEWDEVRILVRAAVVPLFSTTAIPLLIIKKFINSQPSVLPPDSIAEFRDYKLKRGLATQEKLKDPTFALLADRVAVENSHIALPEVPGHRFPIRIYRPEAFDMTRDVKLPVMLYFHGGYWVSGDTNSEDFGCRAIIARGNNIVIVSFDYRVVPDVDWRTLLLDAENALKWLASSAASFGGDVTKGFLIGGAEAGAHVAAATAIRARNRYPNIKLSGQCLIVPTLVAWPDSQAPVEWKGRLLSHTHILRWPRHQYCRRRRGRGLSLLWVSRRRSSGKARTSLCGGHSTTSRRHIFRWTSVIPRETTPSCFLSC